MASHQNQGGASHANHAAQRSAPEWADGLKQLYDSVVEEDLPDSFKNLLDQLDAMAPANGSNDNAGAGYPENRDGR